MSEIANKKKKLPVGIQDFKEIITQEFYYVDKTDMIKVLLEHPCKVSHFTRPHRFGKSLNMSMLKYFFELGTDKSLFDGLDISQETEMCDKYMGQFPVILLNLSGIDGANYCVARSMVIAAINEEAQRYGYLLESNNLDSIRKKLLGNLMSKNMGDVTLITSLKTLTELLERYYGKKVIVLIDDYDAPLAKASEHGYYDEMTRLIHAISFNALKTDPSLEFAFLASCFHQAQGNVFSGFLNQKMFTLLDSRYDNQFGFTDKEVREMLAYYGLNKYYELTKAWYGGYNIGNANVFNPYDVVDWCDQLLTGPNKAPKSYWASPNGNEGVRKLIQKIDDGVGHSDVESLISGLCVQKKIDEQLSYDTIYDSTENMWSLLFATGYLTKSVTRSSDPHFMNVEIPNMEIRTIFRNCELDRFEKHMPENEAIISAFSEALKNGNAAEAEMLLKGLMANTIGIGNIDISKEFKESFYCGLLLVILKCNGGWGVELIRETNYGYNGIAIEIEDEAIGILIEVKYTESYQYKKACEEALKQIDDDDYTAELKDDGMRTVFKYGIACYKKSCKVVCEKEVIKPTK